MGETDDTRTDFELLAEWSAGSQSAANALARRHYASIHRFFDLRAPAFADDLTQQTFLGAVQSQASFRRDSAFKTFLFAIAHKQLMFFLRGEHRVDRLQRFGQDHAAKTSVSVVAARMQEHQLLLAALSQLPLELQVITELHYWEDMNATAIGEVLALNPSTVRSRLARARELLRENVAALTQPGPLRDRMLDELDSVSTAVGRITAEANAWRSPSGA